MADVWKIAEYVESHPDKMDQRWRLAKKLYKAWEYRLALEHLMVLKNEWPDKVNIRRYLAGTYYRLKRYEDAVRELQDALLTWPKEVVLWEQYARALAAEGKPLEASEAWKKVRELQPSHAFAERATRILRAKALGDEKEKSVGPDFSQFAAPMPTASDVVCARCGASNEEEFDRCWKCHAPLAAAQPYHPRPEEQRRTWEKSPESDVPWMFLFVGGALALMATGGYLTYLAYERLTEVEGRPIASLGDFLLIEFSQTKMLTGLLLIMIWPVMLRLGMSLVGADTVENGRVFGAGLFLAALTYVFFWWPPGQPWLRVVIPLGVSMVLITFALGLTIRQGLLAWAFQAGVMLLIALTPAAAVHGFGLVIDLPSIAGASQEAKAPEPITVKGMTPFKLELTFDRSDSHWLDEHASLVRFVAEVTSLEHRTFLEVLEGESTIEFEQISTSPYVTTFDEGAPGKTYTVVIDVPEGQPTSVSLTAQGIQGIDMRRIAPEPEPVPLLE